MLTFTSLSSPSRSATIRSSTGETAWHGPHHSAQKSTITGVSLWRTSCSKVPSVTSVAIWSRILSVGENVALKAPYPDENVLKHLDLPLRAAPFFVVGCPRSGTTLVRRLLTTHPRLAVAPESHWIPRLARASEARGEFELGPALQDVLAELESRWPIDLDLVRAGVARVHPDTFPMLVRTVYAVYAASIGAVRWGDKTPYYALQIPVLLRLFPDAVF